MHKKMIIASIVFTLTGCASQNNSQAPTAFSDHCFSMSGEKIEYHQTDDRFTPVNLPVPVYPAKAVTFGKTGYVIIELDIVGGGAVDNVRVVESCPAKLFDASALEAGAKLRYGIAPDGKILTKIPGVRYKFTFAR